MKSKTVMKRWMPSLLLGAVLAGSVGLSQAQSPIVYNFTNGLQGWSGNEPTGMSATYTWNATGSSTGGGCMQVVFNGTTTTEMDPIVTLPSVINQSQYLSVSIHMMVDLSSGTTGTGGSGGYGNLQAVFRNASYSWDSIWYGTLYPPAANNWVTYTFIIQQPYQPAEQYLQFQFQAASGSSAPVTVYIDNVTVTPLPDPWVADAFTNSSVVGSAWDSTEDAPFYNPVTGAGPTFFTPPGSWEIQIADPGGYNGWNQYGPNSPFDFTRFQWMGLDVYVDGSSGSTYGGAQILAFGPNYSGLQYIGGMSFNAGMVGKWTHFNFPVAVTGITNSPAFAIQGTPGSDGGTDTTTFHVDNLEFWSPQTPISITSLTPGTPGGVKMAVDADGTANQYDQEGITSPSADNNATDYFWMNQYPATYSLAITNFPSPAVAPGFDAHLYIVNGDTITTGTTGGWSYNQTYSGVPYNAYDYAGLRIQNSFTNGGVVAIFEWKTNSPNANATNTFKFTLTQYASADGTWTLNFSDNQHATLLGPDGNVAGTFTLPDFGSDPNYANNFSPATSMVQLGLAKNDTNNDGVNDGQSAIFTGVSVTNANNVVFGDNFAGPGLTASNAWQIAEYYQDAADRVTWQPQGTGWWLKWNSTQSGLTVQTTSNLLGSWTNVGSVYTYVDTTGTNTLGALPATNLPAGNAAFFRLQK